MCRPPEVGGRDCGCGSNGLAGTWSIPNANGLGFDCDMEDDRDILPTDSGGIAEGKAACEGMVGCVGEWKAEDDGVYARFVARGCGMPVRLEPAPESECECRETVGRLSGQELVRAALENDVDSGAGAVAGPEGNVEKSCDS